MHQICPVNDVTAGTRACYGRQVLIRVTSFAKANNVFGGFEVSYQQQFQLFCMLPM